MSIDSILSQIDAEISRLQQVRKLLAGVGSISSTVVSKARKTKAAGTTAKRKRVLSPEARKRIADAQRRRWAAQKKANKKDS